MRVDPTEHPESVYRILNSLVVPRPIGWISTISSDGQDNLAPFSYFNAVSHRPPTVLFAPGTRDGELKDTAQNALDTGEFVANLVTEDLVKEMDQTSVATDESEFDLVGLERAPAKTVVPPRVADALASLECTVSESVHIGESTVIFGQVQSFYVHKSLMTDDSIDARKIKAVGRFGGPFYTGTDLLDYTRGTEFQN